MTSMVNYFTTYDDASYVLVKDVPVNHMKLA